MELLFTVALATVIVGAATLLYGAAASGTLDAAAIAETGSAGDALTDELDFYCRSALDASVVTIASRPVLRLTMPAVRAPRDGRGMVVAYSPSYTHPRLGPAYEPGETVWIYAGAPPSGTTIPSIPSIASVGNVPYLARRNDGLQPTAADVDANWTFLDSGRKVRRFPGAYGFGFFVTPSLRSVTWIVTTTAGTGSDPAVYDAGRARSFRTLQTGGSAVWTLGAPQ